MSIEVISNTDSKEAVSSAKSDAAPKETVEENKSASVANAKDENTEESETSEVSDEVESQEAEESDDENEDDESVKDDEPKPKKNKGFKNRIDKLRGRLSEKDQEIERWRQLALKGQNNPEPQNTEATKPKASDSGKPNPDNFDSHEAYVEAVADWKYEQKESERKAKETETQLKSDYEKQTADHNKRISEFKKDKPDYDEKVKTFLEDYGDSTGDYHFAPALQRAFTNKSGPALMYELLNDPDELVRINGLSYDDALLELGEIKARLKKSSSESTQEKILPKQTKAPPPPKPISSGKAGARKSIFDPDLSQSEYEQLRREQMRKKA